MVWFPEDSLPAVRLALVEYGFSESELLEAICTAAMIVNATSARNLSPDTRRSVVELLATHIGHNMTPRWRWRDHIRGHTAREHAIQAVGQSHRFGVRAWSYYLFPDAA